MLSAELELDYRTTDDNHDYMIDWIDAEVTRLGRCLTWDEARAVLRDKLDLRTDGEEVLSEWLSSTAVDIVSWRVKGIPGVAWGNYETREWAEQCVQHYLQKTGQKLDYEIVWEGE